MISSLNFPQNIDFFQKVKNLRWNLLEQHMQWLSCKVALSYFNKIWKVRKQTYKRTVRKSSPSPKTHWEESEKINRQNIQKNSQKIITQPQNTLGGKWQNQQTAPLLTLSLPPIVHNYLVPFPSNNNLKQRLKWPKMLLLKLLHVRIHTELDLKPEAVRYSISRWKALCQRHQMM